MEYHELSGAHVQRTLAYLVIPSYRATYLNSLHTDAQRTWAKQLLDDFEAGQIRNVTLVPGLDSVCARCVPYRQSECTYRVEPVAMQHKKFPFGTTSVDELLKNFNAEEYIKAASDQEHAFVHELMQHM